VNTIVSVQATIEINGDISLSSLSRKLDHTNINKKILTATLHKHQEELIDRLCGERYSRVERSFRRAGTSRRTLVTRHGNITLRVIKVRSVETGRILTPLLLDLGVEPRRRIVDDLALESAEAATLLTYRDAVKVIESLTEAQTSRHRVHRYVQAVGSYVGEERRKAVPARVDVMYGDGTKTHGLGGGKNMVNVVLGKDQDTDCKHLLSLEVNKG
jgi:transposase-like protein